MLNKALLLQARPPLVIVVFGHTRVRSLRYVLEGLRREGVLHLTQVWLDGHHEMQSLFSKVDACQKLDLEFPEAKFIKYGSRAGPCKLMTDASRTLALEFTDIIGLEDDCYPAPGAISALLDKLDEVRDDPSIFSVYADRFNVDNEDAGVSCFQSWGWATTAEKLQLINAELAKFWQMSEPQYLHYLREQLTPELMLRLNEIPGRSRLDSLHRRFDFDSSVDFILALHDIKNKPTAQRFIWNFGQDIDSWHFSGGADKFKAPPFNMISEEELVEKFALSSPELQNLSAVESGRSYYFDAGGNGRILLSKNWGEPETWGTWSCGDLCSLKMSGNFEKSETINFNFSVNSFVAATNPRLDVTVSINGSYIKDWVFDLTSFKGERIVSIPEKLWHHDAVNYLEFAIKSPRSPRELGYSSDERKLGIGLVSMNVLHSNGVGEKVLSKKT